MEPVHLFLALMVLGGLVGAWTAQRAGYGPGQFAALVVLSVAAFAVIAWVLVVLLELGAPDGANSTGADERPGNMEIAMATAPEGR